MILTTEPTGALKSHKADIIQNDQPKSDYPKYNDVKVEDAYPSSEKYEEQKSEMKELSDEKPKDELDDPLAGLQNKPIFEGLKLSLIHI